MYILFTMVVFITPYVELQLRPGDDSVSSVNDFSHYNNSGSLPLIAQEYQKYCPWVKLCTVPLDTSAITPTAPRCCGSCSCSKDCFKEGNCCPDILQYENESVAIATKSCVRPQLLEFGVTNKSSSSSYLLTHRCHPSYSNELIRRRCEEIPKLPQTFEELLSLIPASVKSKNKQYRNRFCGICNNEDVNDLTLWRSYIECSTKGEFRPESFADMIQTIATKKKCNIIFRSDGVPFDKCDIGEYTRCNQTGSMSYFDSALEHKCNSFTSKFLTTYRNVFCYMCNVRTDPGLCDGDHPSGGFDFVAFNALLDYNVIGNGDTEQTIINPNHICGIKQKYDKYKDVCRDISCGDGYEFFNGTCRNYFAHQNIRSYELILTYIPEGVSTVCVSRNSSATLFTELKSQLRSAGIFNDVCSINFAFYPGNETCGNADISISYILAHVEISMSMVHNLDLLLNSLIPIEASNITIISNNNSVVLFITASNRNYGVPFGTLASNRNYRDPLSLNKLEYLHSYYNSIPKWTMVCTEGIRLKRINRYQLCPRIRLNFTEYRRVITREGVCLPDINLCIDDGQYSLVGLVGAISICSEHYFSHIKKLELPFNVADPCSSVIGDIKDIPVMFSLIVTLISMICLIITIVTYSLFPCLRSIPGMNNLWLSVTLLIAQILYQFGIGNRTWGVWCQIIGGLIHYFWIATLCWMNICTIHMFRVFSKLRARKMSSKNNEIHTVLKYFLYCSTVPLIPVLANIIASLELSDHSDAGYGGCLCYISNTKMIAFTFALPIGIIVLVNVVFFVFVFVFIHRALSGNKSLHQKDRTYLAVYIKLSCLTGLTWVFGFLHTWIRHDALYYIFVLLNAGQGFLIFLAFICNRRIMNLYLELFKCKAGLTKGSSTTRSTDTKTHSSTIKSSKTSSNKSSSSSTAPHHHVEGTSTRL